MAWTDIANADIDKDSPLDEDLYEELRDNDRELRIANVGYLGRYRSAWTTGSGTPYLLHDHYFFMPDWERWAETGREIELGLNMQVYYTGTPSLVVGVELWVDYDWTARTVGDTPANDNTTGITWEDVTGAFDLSSQVPGTTGQWNYYTGIVLDDTWGNGQNGYDGDGNFGTRSNLSFEGRPPWQNRGWTRLQVWLTTATNLGQVICNQGTANDVRLRV